MASLRGGTCRAAISLSGDGETLGDLMGEQMMPSTMSPLPPSLPTSPTEFAHHRRRHPSLSLSFAIRGNCFRRPNHYVKGERFQLQHQPSQEKLEASDPVSPE